jgi:hypothetical protein
MQFHICAVPFFLYMQENVVPVAVDSFNQEKGKKFQYFESHQTIYLSTDTTSLNPVQNNSGLMLHTYVTLKRK